MTDMTTDDLFEEVARAEGIGADILRAYCKQLYEEEPTREIARECLEVYEGEFLTEGEFAETLFDSLGENLPDMIRPHVDWDDVWHCELRHDYFEVDGYYFRSV